MNERIKFQTAEQDQYLQIAQTRAYYQGFRDGLLEYAWWKDGVQYVGTCGRTLKEAFAEVDKLEQNLLQRYKID